LTKNKQTTIDYYFVDNDKISLGKELYHTMEDAAIYCSSKESPVWYFFKYNESIPQTKINNALGFLRVSNLSTSDSGYYECRGRTSEGFKFAARIELIVMGES